MDPLVSIIVPVYNGEKHLRRCIDSILVQEYRTLELLLVDDGSSDGSGEICEEYAGKDARVHVFHKENTGVSDTRNFGISRASGEYLQFVDCDDWITPDATKLLVRSAREHGCDLVIADFYRVVGERISQKGDIEEDGVMSLEEFASCMMENPADFYYGVLWNKLYRREIVENYALRMNTEINWCEDFLFNLEYIRHCAVFCALHAPVYYYVKTKGSLVTQGMSISKTIRMKLTVFECYDNFYRNLLDETQYEKSRLQVYRFLVGAAKDGMVAPAILPGTRKLGDERTGICGAAASGAGALADIYRQRKLLDYYLETAALKNDLPLEGMRLLLFCSQTEENCTRRELEDLLGISGRKLTVLLQRLTARGLIHVKERRGRKKEAPRVEISILPGAASALGDIRMAVEDYDSARSQTLEEEELIQYNQSNEKIQGNIRRILLGGGED